MCVVNFAGGKQLQGYLAHKRPPPPYDPTSGLCLGPYGGPRGGGCFLCARYPCTQPVSAHSGRAHLERLGGGQLEPGVFSRTARCSYEPYTLLPIVNPEPSSPLQMSIFLSLSPKPNRRLRARILDAPIWSAHPGRVLGVGREGVLFVVGRLALGGPTNAQRLTPYTKRSGGEYQRPNEE